jgi:cyanophycinase
MAGEGRPTGGIRPLREVKRVSPAKVEEHHTRGWIVPVGGAEDKEQDRLILRRFIEVSGGSAARIAVIPTASRLPDTGPRYERIFRDLGAHNAHAASRSSAAPTPSARTCSTCSSKPPASSSPAATSSSSRPSSAAPRSPSDPPPQRPRRHRRRHLGRRRDPVRAHDRLRRGRRHPEGRAGTLAPGFGLTNRVVIDQHFRQRDRLGRLLSALAFNPFAVGIGLDEDTAAFIDPDDVLHVEGAGAITIVDVSAPRPLEHGPRQDPASPVPHRHPAAHPHPRRHVQPAHQQGTAALPPE